MMWQILSSSNLDPLLISHFYSQIIISKILKPNKQFVKRIMLETQIILQKILQTANVVSDYW